MNNQVSIYIPAYNAESTIREVIDSILNQSYKFDEIILVNDNSNDKTSEICKEESKIDDRFIYFKPVENMGPTWNTNFVLGQAKTKYFVWAFADDIWEENFLEENRTIFDMLEKYFYEIMFLLFVKCYLVRCFILLLLLLLLLHLHLQ